MPAAAPHRVEKRRPHLAVPDLLHFEPSSCWLYHSTVQAGKPAGMLLGPAVRIGRTVVSRRAAPAEAAAQPGHLWQAAEQQGARQQHHQPCLLASDACRLRAAFSVAGATAAITHDATRALCFSTLGTAPCFGRTRSIAGEHACGGADRFRAGRGARGRWRRARAAACRGRRGRGRGARRGRRAALWPALPQPGAGGRVCRRPGSNRRAVPSRPGPTSVSRPQLRNPDTL